MIMASFKLKINLKILDLKRAKSNLELLWVRDSISIEKFELERDAIDAKLSVLRELVADT